MSQSQSNAAASVLQYQELERLQFSQDLQRNPAQYNQYVNQRIGQMTDEVFNRKRTAFQKAQIDLGRYMDMDHNAGYYKTRSKDVVTLTDMMDEANQKVMANVQHDKQLSKRQFEINDWANANKLETLFFLQVFFCVSLLMAAIIYAKNTGLVTATFASFMTGVLVIFVAGLGYYRYYYTANTRDTRLWNRRYFGKATPPKPAVKCDPSGNADFNMADFLPEEITKCASQQAGRFNAWQDNLQNEILNYQQTGQDPAPGTGSILCGGTGA